MDKDIIKVMLIDDDEDDYFITEGILSESKGVTYKLDWVSTYEKALIAINRKQHDVF